MASGKSMYVGGPIGIVVSLDSLSGGFPQSFLRVTVPPESGLFGAKRLRHNIRLFIGVPEG